MLSEMTISSGQPRPRAHDGTTEVEQRIFAATERVLERIGARDLSVAEILQEAGIARGTFYHYFSSKWEVVNKLAALVMADIDARIQPLVIPANPESSAERLRESIIE